MKQRYIVGILIILLVLFVSFDETFDYGSIKKLIKYNEFKISSLQPSINDISKQIKSEIVNESFINNHQPKLFPSSHYWILNKYEDGKKIEITYQSFSGESYLPNNYKWASSQEFIENEVDRGYGSENKKGYIIVFPDKQENLIIYEGLECYLYKNNNIRSIAKLALYDKKKVDYGRYYIIDIKGEYIVSLKENQSNPKLKISDVFTSISSFGITIYNIKEKKLYSFNLEDLQCYFNNHMGNDIIPFYDLSPDRRYIFFYGETYYGIEGMTPGAYAFDWWEMKLYKISNEETRQITYNNLDGYLYLKTVKMNIDKKKYITYPETYVRIKNIEKYLTK